MLDKKKAVHLFLDVSCYKDCLNTEIEARRFNKCYMYSPAFDMFRVAQMLGLFREMYGMLCGTRL